MTLVAGTKLGPYTIVGPLGAGGMGEVYRAKDTRLGREVAIKGLPEAFASHPERLARFEREARLLASLNHANIAGIFGLEESGGTPYLVLELVEGETLAARLSRGPLPVREALEVGGQVAAAIEAAHEGGVIHRDLKPGNVMITPGRVAKVLDFGLAKGGAAEAASSPDLAMSPTVALSATGAGVVLGTAAYMSPEQARGQAVDRRTDVWAFGCLLFEMLTGRPVFGGETSSDIIARILEREPDWNALPPAVPSRLREVVRRCLTKAAEKRPRDIGDLRSELGDIALELSSPSGVRAPSAEKPSLAVLYFENLANDAESEYFCAGITEDILTDLSKIKALRVASRNAVARYRGSAADLQQVGAELGVGAVLEGSVRRAGGRVRISAQLINVADGFHLWAERYDRTMEDVFAVQEEIASAIAEALRVALSPSEATAIAQTKPRDARAYDLYLRGRERYGQYSEASLRAALELFRQATEIDADYALAWAGIADCHGQLCQWGRDVDVAEETRLGLEAARRAIALNPKLPDAYKAEALNLRFAGDGQAATAALHRALEADPRFSPALLNLTVECVTRANLAEAERYVLRALDVDPQDTFAGLWLVTLCLVTRRDERALEWCDRIRQLSSESFYLTGVHVGRMWVHLRRGDLAAATRELAEGIADGARPDDMRAMEAALAARDGRAEHARRLLPGLRATTGLGAFTVHQCAVASVLIGDLELAEAFLAVPIMRDLAPAFAHFDPALHPLLARSPMGKWRGRMELVWPLEAPMMEAAVHRVFREVRIESGLPAASEVR